MQRDGFSLRRHDVDHTIGRLRRGDVAAGRTDGQVAAIPCRTFVFADRDKRRLPSAGHAAAERVCDEEQAAGLQTNYARPLSAGQGHEFGRTVRVCLAVVMTDRPGHLAIDIAVLPAKTDERAVFAEYEAGVTSGRASFGIAPGLAAVAGDKQARVVA